MTDALLTGSIANAPSATLLRTMVVDDESTIRGPVSLCLETLGHHVVEAASVEDAVQIASRDALDLALVDIRLGTASGLDLMARLLSLQPRLKIIVITAYGSVDVAVRAMSRGAVDFLCKPFTPSQVAAAVNRAAALRSLETGVGVLADRLGTAGPEADYATTSAQLQDAIVTVRRAAPADTPVLITGEPGTGKTVLARAVHGWGRRPEGPFVGVDCALHSTAYVDLAIFGDTYAGEQLVVAEKPPLVEISAGGTLLLKNIEGLSPRSAERLGQLLDGKTYELHGKSVVSDCRLIVTAGKLSAVPANVRPLLDRIRVVLPPLRHRAEDIPMLAQRYLAVSRQSDPKQVLGFSSAALDRLLAYEWPGNLRELRQVVDHAFRAASSDYIEPQHLPASVQKGAVQRHPRAGDPITLKELEAAHIREVLAAQPSLQSAAEILGVDVQALYRRRKQYGLE